MNWFQRHLNWTWVLVYLLWFVLNASESVVAGLVAAVFWLIVSGWVIKQKGRRLWWLLLSWLFSPLWLSNKKKKLASSQKSMMPLIQKAKTGTGCFIQIIGGILWLGCGLYIMIWEFSVIADALSTWVAILAVFLFPVLFVFAVPIAWFLTGTFPLGILILWLLTWVGMLIMRAGASIKGGEFGE